uniref:Uncharacterized protein n=1 Tax=Caenorhabditis japonica TaxID=281687 RepID=A0A8R1EDG7_CAEJA
MHEKIKSLEETIVAHQKRIEDMEMAIKDEKKKKEEDPAKVKERRRSIVAQSSCPGKRIVVDIQKKFGGHKQGAPTAPTRRRNIGAGSCVSYWTSEGGWKATASQSCDVKSVCAARFIEKRAQVENILRRRWSADLPPTIYVALRTSAILCKPP